MKLEVGMYVRTDKGCISRIIDFKPITKYKKYNTLYFENVIGECLYTNEELKELKASHNIIDLIEVGDYVNGGQVREIKEGYIRISGGKSLWAYIDNLKDIKSIVTKEQFESMSYKVGE